MISTARFLWIAIHFQNLLGNKVGLPGVLIQISPPNLLSADFADFRSMSIPLKFNSSPLKKNSWKTSLWPFWALITSQGVSFIYSRFVDSFLLDSRHSSSLNNACGHPGTYDIFQFWPFKSPKSIAESCMLKFNKAGANSWIKLWARK